MKKLQYDINTEAAKISALLSGKIGKYEYLTGEKILPSNQQHIIEQAKFTYSPLRKAFENQTKTIEDQGKKQVNALKSLESLKQKELKPKEAKPIEYNDSFVKGLAEIRKNNQPIDFNDLTDNFKGSKHAPINFIKFEGPNDIFKSIHDGDITLEDVEKKQIKLISDLGHIKQRPWRYKSLEQTQTIRNIENLYNSREEVVRMFNDYAKNMSRNIYESKQGEGLKILTPKQTLQRSSLALTQIKAGDNSETLLNDIRQLVYSLYQSKTITKKVYNNIIKSIKV